MYEAPTFGRERGIGVEVSQCTGLQWQEERFICKYIPWHAQMPISRPPANTLQSSDGTPDWDRYDMGSIA